MAEYIELTEELILAMCAGARAISNTKKYHGTIFVKDVFSNNPKEIPYLHAADILYAASETKPVVDVAPVRHGLWKKVAWWQHQNRYECNECSVCGCRVKPKFTYNYCPNCGAKMDLES